MHKLINKHTVILTYYSNNYLRFITYYFAFIIAFIIYFFKLLRVLCMKVILIAYVYLIA